MRQFFLVLASAMFSVAVLLGGQPLMAADGINSNGQDVPMGAGGSEFMVLTHDAKVGIGANASNLPITPQTMLDVGGEVRVGFTGIACTASISGAMRYNASTNIMEGCNGTTWVSLATLGMPSGAVLPFNLASCPNGWQPFTQAAGRTIIGVGNGSGLTERNLSDTGGEENYTISFGNLPTLVVGQGGAAMRGANLSGGWSGGVGSRGAETSTLGGGNPLTISGTGADTPINTVPPFIALLYCQKS